MMLVFRLRIMRNLSALCAAVEEKLFLMETSGVAADSGITNTDSRLRIRLTELILITKVFRRKML